ncbi:type IV pilus twitching motility protein PilT [Pseudenhygromyxa sp. WMMC2535]|uniref:type IV pilus twitching motility protein PilT n=1 Tax=Pseudenhygromyxa sp. WMMC2535 TaxID=2712867 RepID=UPI001555D0AC|nr:type IV pilus twitching motility protein PilT [Pseudenhygromyxa sp. WMMC2535]NVB36846.1 type IV pilus twitching motility protein PilT [Pseudenhygromyxa sp. WMMC2535]
MNEIFDRVLMAARKLGASDVHLKVGRPPIFRIRGQLRTLKDVPAMNNDVIETFAVNIMNQRQHQIFMENCEVDLAYGTEDGYRYRVNVFRQRGTTGMVMRIIPSQIPAFDRLNLPPRVREMSTEHRGLVLVTGITGSGKSTTLASLLEVVNTQRPAHIVTIEDPIEYVFEDKRAIVNQREVGFDTMGFKGALRSALRQDPDVILVGEMRDHETIRTVMLAAETGHLVFSTLHTVDATETIARIVQMFPHEEQIAVRLQLASILRGIVSQRLLPRADGRGMIPAVEILVNTPRVQEMISDQMRTHELVDAIREGANPYGMVTFDQSLIALVKRKLVTYEVALAASTNPADFELTFRGVTGGPDDDDEDGEFFDLD